MVKHTLETWYHMAVKISSAYKRVIQNVDTQNVNNSIIAWGEWDETSHVDEKLSW